MLSHLSFSVLCFSSTHSLGITFFCFDTLNQSSTRVDWRRGLQWWWMSLRLVWVSASPARCLSLPLVPRRQRLRFAQPHHGVLAIDLWCAPPSELPGMSIFRIESVLAWRIRRRLDLSSIARGLGSAVMTRLARICRDLPECGESARLLQWPLLLPADVCFFHIQESGTMISHVARLPRQKQRGKGFTSNQSCCGQRTNVTVQVDRKQM